MIRRYVRRMPIQFSLAGQPFGSGEVWMGLEIDSDESPPAEWLETQGLESAALHGDAELDRRIGKWEYMAVGEPAAN